MKNLDELAQQLADIAHLEYHIQLALLRAEAEGLEPAFQIMAADEDDAKWIREYMSNHYPGIMAVVSAKPLAQLFKTGILVATPGVLALKEQGLKLEPLLQRHLSGDWGDLSEADKKENEFSLKNGFRILSSYNTPYGKVYIITEHDRSATTLLLPEDF